MKSYRKWITLYAVILTVAVAYLFSGYGDWKRVSPFTDVKIEKEQIIVEYKNEFYLLQSIEGISSNSLIATSKKAYGNKWIKRIREDIAEVLIKAGAPESNHVSLVLSDLKTADKLVIEKALMTKENRAKIYSGS